MFDMIAQHNNRPQPESSLGGRHRDLIDLLVRAEQAAKEIELGDVQKCLNLAIHLVKLKSQN